MVSAYLRGGNGNGLEKSTNLVVGKALQSLTFRLSYTSEEIRKEIAGDGPYAISKLDLLSFISKEGAFLDDRRHEAYTFANIRQSDLCRSAIEIGNRLGVVQNLRSGYIDSLDLSLPVYVATSGSYQITLKVTDRYGQDLRQYGFSRSLVAGNNTVTVNLPRTLTQTQDGPYTVESVLITGMGASAQVSQVGSTGDLSRWQFYPTIQGDLDGDGDVDEEERDLLLAYRNQTALSPGDRRDLNRDGKIDLKDARLITTLTCAKGRCPIN